MPESDTSSIAEHTTLIFDQFGSCNTLTPTGLRTCLLRKVQPDDHHDRSSIAKHTTIIFDQFGSCNTLTPTGLRTCLLRKVQPDDHHDKLSFCLSSSASLMIQLAVVTGVFSVFFFSRLGATPHTSCDELKIAHEHQQVLKPQSRVFGRDVFCPCRPLRGQDQSIAVLLHKLYNLKYR